MFPARPPCHALRQALKATLVVVASAALVGVVLLGFGLFSVHSSSKAEERVRLDLRSLRSAVRIHVFKYSCPPPNEGWVEALVRLQVLERQPLDPWGNPYVYESNGADVELLSWGRDGAPGGDGADQDVVLSFNVALASTDAG
jgi:hypothetical protein